jgi:excisionase family DNA binding protein
MEDFKLTYTVREASQATGLGQSTIWRYIKEQKLKATHIGGRTLIKTGDLRSWIDSFEKQGAA